MKNIVITILVLSITVIVLSFMETDFEKEPVEIIESVEEVSEEITFNYPDFGEYDQQEVLLGEETFVWYIADTEEKRATGLSGQIELEDSEGLLFIFESSSAYGFWMKDMNFSIDIIWINEAKEIVHIEENVAPDTYPTVFYPQEQALYILELFKGRSSELGISVGDMLEF